MSFGAAFAQAIWAASNFDPARRFANALATPEIVQSDWLRKTLQRDANSAFGREHGFGSIQNYDDFTKRVPPQTWDAIEPWVTRIRAGELKVLTSEKITHLAPTSGSSGARKLIPFTAGLQRGFSNAVGAWMTDLVRQRPSLLMGSAYWSVSPMERDDDKRTSPVPIGFADDADYLGGAQACLVRQALAVPSSLRHITDQEQFWYQTALALLKRTDLRLISVWHPSFLDLLLENAEKRWPELCSEIAKTHRSRARDLERIGATNPAAWWQGLRVISCWGEQAAASGFHALQRRFPQVWVQAKGLLATEAVITFPWRGQMPLAITSHFFEFIDEAGEIRRAHQLEVGQHYEILVTNGGGLWRYQLGDLVECNGHMDTTPTLRFLGRAGNVSDLRGEKLSEPFVAEVLRELWPNAEIHACLVVEPERSGYVLRAEAKFDPRLAEKLETALQQNPNYELARRLGQLQPVRVEFDPNGGESASLASKGGGLGGSKPKILISSIGQDERC